MDRRSGARTGGSERPPVHRPANPSNLDHAPLQASGDAGETYDSGRG